MRWENILLGAIGFVVGFAVSYGAMAIYGVDGDLRSAAAFICGTIWQHAMPKEEG